GDSTGPWVFVATLLVGDVCSVPALPPPKQVRPVILVFTTVFDFLNVKWRGLAPLHDCVTTTAPVFPTSYLKKIAASGSAANLAPAAPSEPSVTPRKGDKTKVIFGD
ncbi:hypothetical protein T492DRAFT_1120388, partial [Pavlovales sp. CCMP2436]